MKFGLIYISRVTTPHRKKIVEQSLMTLAKTDVTGLDAELVIFYRESPLMDYEKDCEALDERYLHLVKDEGTYPYTNDVTYASVKALKELVPDATHIVFLYDDFIFNPQWLNQLVGVIERHPDAKAWSVYRSSYTRHHRIVDGDGVDVRMTMHDGMGCMTVGEWDAFETLIKSQVGNTTVPPNHELGGGFSIDIFHAYAMPGDRWATSRDYWQNLGIHAGLGRQDQAIDFVGEE